MNVSNDFCPFMCWSVYWCFVVKVSIPQESKNTTNETNFYFLQCTWHLKNVSFINLIFILIVKTGKLPDGFLFYRNFWIANLTLYRRVYGENGRIMAHWVNKVAVYPFAGLNILASELNCSHIREILLWSAELISMLFAVILRKQFSTFLIHCTELRHIVFHSCSGLNSVSV